MENASKKKSSGSTSRAKISIVSVELAPDGERGEEKNIRSIAASLDTYLDDIGQIAYAYPITTKAMNAGRSKSLSELVDILRKYSKKN